MDTAPLPPEVLRLTRREQKYAVPFYSKWMAIFMTDRPDKYDDNLKRALNGAYGTAARYWLGPTALFAIPAAFILSVWRLLPGVVLMCIAGVLLCRHLEDDPGAALLPASVNAQTPRDR